MASDTVSTTPAGTLGIVVETTRLQRAGVTSDATGDQ
jgi:hypothetical protein